MKKIALLTSPSFASAEAIWRIVDAHANHIAVIGLSDPLRDPLGAGGRRTRKILLKSHFLLAPYLLINFVLPRIGALARRILKSRRSLRALCCAKGLPLLGIDNVNAPDLIARLQSFGVDAVLLCHFDQIVDEHFLAAFPEGVVNVHPSLLPLYRGACPTLHALTADQPRFGVTLHEVVPEIDCGPILAQEALDLPNDTSAAEAARRLHLAAVPLVASWMNDECGRARSQDGAIYCYWPDAGMIKAMHAKGRRAVCCADILAAMRAPL
ncbi:hypothetical protein GJ654_00825 [Rhodoblastus acidophilus]|uniref:Formyl transferase N-terminal domain-containing protein n=1 Tax=Rhodoblastus acidophilus TaxID=1074 RepID=A0A6N8DH21_RHOAC|nr:formyltransferase family protein [Rhodoblastus acidophilus]MCW2272617.1 hypothetical protein [Rhodoblastus acidophilus]MTV29529.1 hypothetical protein [Rhodoblastus acidophilus]